MIALWMAYATVVAGVVGLAAGVVDRIAGGALRQRRWAWVLALALSVAIPGWAAFRSPVPAAESEQTDGQPGRPVASEPASGVVAARLAELIARADTQTLVRFDAPFTIGWGIAVAFALAAYAAANVSLARRRRVWRAAVLDGQAVLLARGVGPAVVGALRPEIVVPEWALGLPDDQRALMIEHERQHVRAKDPLVLHAAAIIALLMPWNVAAWWLNRRLRLAVELDCDARVLARGGDPAVYGALLLDVCSRPRRPGALLSPALLERTSSLATRILAMNPTRTRFARWRIALGTGAALGLIILACDMPSPEILAPNGKDEASKRLYGKLETVVASDGVVGLRKTVARYFPVVARGEGEASILFLVKSDKGDVVLTEAQPASDFARMPMRRDASAPRPEPSDPAGEAAELEMKVRDIPVEMVKLRAYEGEARALHTKIAGNEFEERVKVLPPMKLRQSQALLVLPTGVGALKPDDIASIDVSKHAAGTVAPKAVSIISIVLKPGAVVPLTERVP